MKKIFHAMAPIISGMIAAELISTAFIYYSNKDYHRSLMDLAEAGYVIVPNRNVLPSLMTFQAALNGGLFFTLTVGLALSVIAGGMARLGSLPFSSRAANRIFLALPLPALVVAANYHGFAAFFSTLLIVVPMVAFGIARKWPPAISQPEKKGKRRQRALLTATFIALAATMAYKSDMGIFLSIRDRLLLTTEIGAKLNDFYYENSLYSAHVFQSLGQHLIKPCNLSTTVNSPLTGQIKQRLIGNDYLPIKHAADIHFRLSGDELIFQFNQKEVLSAKANAFIERPRDFLNEFSSKSDPNSFFRNCTMIALLFSGTVTVYVIFCLPIVALVGRFFPAVIAPPAGILLCIAIALLLVHLPAPDSTVNPDSLKEALSSQDSRRRISALQLIHDQSIDIFNYPAIGQMAESPHAAERYWLARALSKSRRPESRLMILKLLNDKQFNVVCMAYYALGFQGNQLDIRTVLDRLKASSNWYVQWYGYRTLRKLGWTQNPLI